MNKPNISPDFTIEDIHRIREYNHEVTKDLSFEERKDYYAKGAESVLSRIKKIKEDSAVYKH